ncbi:MAG: phosphoribosyltransferase family protein [Nitrososphaerota archaeon]
MNKIIIDESSFRYKTYVFNDRYHAGELLTEKLKEYKDNKDAYIFAIPAGGVQVGAIIAKKLNLPLDLAITRKIHIPWNPEAGFGAISWDGIIILNKEIISYLKLTKEEINQCIIEEKKIIEKRMKIFRGNKPFPNIENKIAIIVDDGLASGFSMLATIKSIKKMKPKEIIVAIPTASLKAINLIKPYVNKIVCLNIRSDLFFAVADAYKEWYDLEDEDVLKILNSLNNYKRE